MMLKMSDLLHKSVLFLSEVTCMLLRNNSKVHSHGATALWHIENVQNLFITLCASYIKQEKPKSDIRYNTVVELATHMQVQVPPESTIVRS